MVSGALALFFPGIIYATYLETENYEINFDFWTFCAKLCHSFYEINIYFECFYSKLCLTFFESNILQYLCIMYCNSPWKNVIWLKGESLNLAYQVSTEKRNWKAMTFDTTNFLSPNDFVFHLIFITSSQNLFFFKNLHTISFSSKLRVR